MNLNKSEQRNVTAQPSSVSQIARKVPADVVVLLAGITAALHVGKLPPAIPVLQQELGITLVQSGFLLSLVQLAGMLGGLVISAFSDAFGLRRSILTGLLLLALASIVGGLARSAEALLWLRGIEGLGFLMVTLSAPALIRKLVRPENLNLRLGWWSCYMGLGIGSALLLAPWVLAGVGWQGWWWVLAAISILMLFAVLLYVPADRAQQQEGDAAVPGLGPIFRRLWKTLSHAGPWWIALTFAMYSSQWLAVVGFLPSIYVEAGLSGTVLGVLTALVALINAMGNAVAGRLMHAGLSPVRLVYVGFIAMGVSAVVAFSGWSADWPIVRYLAVLAFSGLGGIIPASLFALSVQIAPDKSTISTSVGWMLQLSAIGQFVGPPVVAAVGTMVGGWQLTWVVTMICSVAGVVFIGLVGRVVSAKLG